MFRQILLYLNKLLFGVNSHGLEDRLLVIKIKINLLQLPGMLIIISGLPGTGKTTFARALAQKMHVHHLNSDMIRDELGKRGQYDPDTKSLIYERMQERTERYLQAGETVIVDATFYKKNYRKPYFHLAENYGVPLKWIELEAGEQTIRKRVEQKRKYSEADFSVYQKIKAAYEPLSIKHLILSSDDRSVSEMLEEAATFITDGY